MLAGSDRVVACLECEEISHSNQCYLLFASHCPLKINGKNTKILLVSVHGAVIATNSGCTELKI